MAVQTPPFVLQNSSHGAELARREALASLSFGSAGGVVPATAASSANSTAGVAACSDLKVNAPASGMSVLVNAGQCYVPGSLGSGSGYGIGIGYGMPTVTLNGASAPTVASTAVATQVQLTTQGIYYCYNDNSAGQVSLTVASSNASLPRIDVVIAQVEDSAYSGANNDWKLAVVTGTAAASPTVPALPANSLVLAYVWVPAASSSVTAGNILDLRVACNRNPFRAEMYMANAWTAGTTDAAIPYDTVYSDITGSLTLGASSKLTCPVGGLWHVEYGGQITPNALTVLRLLKNGALFRQTTRPSTDTGDCPQLVVTLPCNPGDTITGQARASAAASAGGVGQTVTYFTATLLSPL